MALLDHQAPHETPPHRGASELEVSLRTAFRDHSAACAGEPLRNPILLLALGLGERLKSGDLDLGELERLVKALTCRPSRTAPAMPGTTSARSIPTGIAR